MANAPHPVEPADWLGDKTVVRTLAFSAIVALLLALSGAFGTQRLPLLERMAFWLGVILPGSLVAYVLGHTLTTRLGLSNRPVALSVALVVLVSIVQTPVVLGVQVTVFHQPVTWASFLGTAPSILAVTIALTVMIVMTRQRAPPVTHSAAPGAAPAKFLDRMPARLRGGELYAVEAEDHYLRLRTSKGEDLILMRLSDAVKELEGLEGAQTHRSWWVARDAIVEAERGDGRATLTLKDGVQAPVSRAYARALREAGWF